MPPATAALAAALATLAAATRSAHAYVQTPSSGDGWFDGRATFFGAPAEFANAFKDRGEGAFGDLLWGSCGYFNKPQVRVCVGTGDGVGWAFHCSRVGAGGPPALRRSGGRRARPRRRFRPARPPIPFACGARAVAPVATRPAAPSVAGHAWSWRQGRRVHGQRRGRARSRASVGSFC
jgi:hypothetical protein